MTILLKIMLRPLIFFFASSFILTGCSKETAPPRQDLTGTGVTPSFVNKVWQVSSSSSAATGTLYVFLSEGTLLITSPNTKPLLGRWKHEGGELFMIEEGIPYKTDILRLSADQFSIRSNNPGDPVEITLVPAVTGLLSK